MTLSKAISDFLIDKQCSGYSHSTITDYAVKLNKFCEHFAFLPVSVKDITLQDCRDYYLWLTSHLENSVTVQSYIRSLRAFLNWLYYNEIIDVDICQKFKLPKAKKPFINVLTDVEIQSVYECYPDFSNVIHLRNRVILSLMLDCGLRLEEVVTAKREDLHLVGRYLIVTGKGNKQRSVSFGNQTYLHIKRYLVLCPRASPLLVQSDGSPITRNVIKNMFRRLKVRSGVSRLYPHLLRHTFATRFLENGGDIYTLKDLLGHTTLKQTQHYLHLANTRICRDFSLYSPLDHIKKTNLL